MVVAQEQILGIIRQKGPLLPVQLAKNIGTDILIASAHLSYLVDNKKVLISHTKVGGSPVYYIQGQEARLQEFSSYLNEKDQKTFQLLKTQKVLQDKKLDPLTRLSLRSIKDFAVPLHVIRNQDKLLFWKWYMISTREAEILIRNELGKTNGQVLKEDPPLENTEKVQQNGIEEKNALENAKKKLEKERKLFQKEKKQFQEKLALERQQLLQDVSAEKIIKKKEIPKKDAFLDQITQYFNSKKIRVVSYEILRKGFEIDFILRIPSVVGDLEYYGKAKKKKAITDSDLSSVVVQGQLKKLPVLFFTTGDLTKKAKDLLNTELKKGVVIKGLESNGNKS